MQPLAVRLQERLAPPDERGCIIFLGFRKGLGYGQISVNGKPTRANRVAWEVARGRIPEGLCVLHKCDVPACCNVDHLFLGTYQDNHDDMKAKGRAVNPPH